MQQIIYNLLKLLSTISRVLQTNMLILTLLLTQYIKHETQCFITFDEFCVVSSVGETLCRMLAITSQTK